MEKEKIIMIINKTKIKIGIPEILLAVSAILFMIGIRAWFPVCDVMGDTAMPCHWAGEMLKALSILFLTLSLAHAVIPNGAAKIGVDVSLTGLSVLTLNIPGNIIRTCSNADMACRKSTHPWTIAFCVVMIVLVLADCVLYFSLRSKEKHKRNKVGEKE